MIKAPTLIDTGPLVAIFDKQHPQYQSCRVALAELPSPLLSCWPVITEAAYILKEWSLARAGLFQLLRSQAIVLLPLGKDDFNGIESILEKYQDQKFQLADACLMYLAEREKIDQVLTLDRKDFGVFRTQVGKVLELIPEVK